MEAEGKECEEETLQTAFKKLRVDADSVRAASVSDVSTPRVAPRGGLDATATKPKLSCPKDNWHGCMRKSSRGGSRSQRRRRSKSPILQPPRFTYCGNAALPPPSCLKQQHLVVPELPVPPLPATSGSSAAQKDVSPLGHVFGSASGYKSCVPSPQSCDIPAVPGSLSKQERGQEDTSRAISGPVAEDFRALSQLQGGSSDVVSCLCAQSSCSTSTDGNVAVAQCECTSRQQGWKGVEVYSFTGLRHVVSECERSHSTARTLSTPSSSTSSSLTAGSPRSCSEQARGFVDDITIEDLAGYMEFYLYIPKKMSHMAEMMYT